MPSSAVCRALHQFVRIGAHSMLGGASALVAGTFRQFVIAAGNKAEPHGINVEGLRRRGFSAEAISALRSAYRVVYKSGATLEEANGCNCANLASAGGDGDAPVTALADFIDASQRGHHPLTERPMTLAPPPPCALRWWRVSRRAICSRLPAGRPE